MVKKTFNYFWSLRREFVKYFIVGFSGLFLDMGTLVLFREVFGFAPPVAVIFNQPLVLGYNFTLNKYWSFHSKAIPHKQMVRYAILASWNYFFSWFSMYILFELWGMDYRIARILSITVMVSWNFLLYKYWVYRENKPPLMNPISEY